VAGAWGWQPYHLPVPLSWNLGTVTSWNRLGHSRPVTGLLYLLLYLIKTRQLRQDILGLSSERPPSVESNWKVQVFFRGSGRDWLSVAKWLAIAFCSLKINTHLAVIHSLSAWILSAKICYGRSQTAGERESLNYFCSMVTNDAICTREPKSRVAMEQAAFYKKKALSTRKLI